MSRHEMDPVTREPFHQEPSFGGVDHIVFSPENTSRGRSAPGHGLSASPPSEEAAPVSETSATADRDVDPVPE